MAMFRSCGGNPSEKIGFYDENAKFEQRSTNGGTYNENESKLKWLKICKEGYKYDNGESFVEVICTSNYEWTIGDGAPVPRYYILKKF